MTRFNHQRSTYRYILINHRIATKQLAVIVLKIFAHVVSYILFKLHARNVRP